MDQNKVIAVIGATGAQGSSVVNALKQQGLFTVRALTRNPEAYDGPADEVRLADLDRPETLTSAFEGAYGAFVVTNFWQSGTDEYKQAGSAIDAAAQAGVSHFVWSTLPNVEAISGGEYHVPHFTGKARVNALVENANFRFHTFVEAPFYFQNLQGNMTPQLQADGSHAWVLPLDPDKRVIHMGDITEYGLLVAGVFAHPDVVGNGEIVALVGQQMSFNDVVSTLNANGRNVRFQQVPKEVFVNFFPGADEMAAMLGYFEKYTYLGPDAEVKMALAKKVSIAPFSDFATWVKANGA